MENGKKKSFTEVSKDDVESIKDTYNAFMKNVFNNRQLAIKITANSLYGQTGARTSAFYEKDIAASTTATGRKLLSYGKEIIEGVYGDRICETKNMVWLSLMPRLCMEIRILALCAFILRLEGNPIKGKKALEITIDLAVSWSISINFLKTHTI